MIIPTIFLQNGKLVEPKVTPTGLQVEKLLDNDLEDVYRQFRYAVEICVYDLDADFSATSETQKIIKRFIREGSTRVALPFSTDIEAMYQLLDTGALAVQVPLRSLELVAELPKDRYLVETYVPDESDVTLDWAHTNLGVPESVATALKSSSGLVVHTQSATAASADWIRSLQSILKQDYAFGERRVVVSADMQSAEEVAQVQSTEADIQLSGALLGMSGSPPRILLADALTCSLTTDRPDGLFTTLVVDQQGIALGVVYSSRESIRKSVEVGRGVYQSRKRGLWFKGETSGAVQHLVHIDHDCDADCLRFVVKQVGVGFCHLNRRTCFGGDEGIPGLVRTLLDRRVNAPAGSYTKRLFDDAKLLKAKLHEEADELLEAEEPDHVAAEAADVIYFAMVAAARSGVELADIERHLDRRSLRVRRRAGNAKPAYLAPSGPVEQQQSPQTQPPS